MDKNCEAYLNDISEMVVDEERIVTYKLLSKKLGLHVNIAKQLLQTYLSKQKCDNAFSVSATYLLAGNLIGGQFSVTIATDDSLKTTRSKFVNITSEHLYSVQKSKKLEDIKALSGVSKGLHNTKRDSLSIRCCKSVIKSKSHPKESIEISKRGKVNEDEPKRAQCVFAESEKNTRSPIKIAREKSLKQTIPKAEVDKSHKNTEKSNIANLFANAAKKAKTEDTSSKEVVISGNKEVINKQTEKLKLGEHLSGKKKGSKRKRIHIYSDSEDSGSEHEGRPVSEEELGNVEETNEVLEESVQEQNESFSAGKRKKRKVVDKTVMNEDGYLETRKEIVFETDSENEVHEKAFSPKQGKTPPSVTENDKGTRGAQQNRRQASLLHFFKKN